MVESLEPFQWNWGTRIRDVDELSQLLQIVTTSIRVSSHKLGSTPDLLTNEEKKTKGYKQKRFEVCHLSFVFDRFYGE